MKKTDMNISPGAAGRDGKNKMGILGLARESNNCVSNSNLCVVVDVRGSKRFEEQGALASVYISTSD